MDQIIVKRIYTSAAGAIVSVAAGFLLRRAWKLIVGHEPPDIYDPDVPAKQAVAWFALSTVGAGVAVLLSKRGALSRLSR